MGIVVAEEQDATLRYYTDEPSADTPLTSSRTLIDTGDSSCDYFHEQFRAEIGRINAVRAPYNPIGRNSNATARYLLRSIGLTVAKPTVWVPGWTSTFY